MEGNGNAEAQLQAATSSQNTVQRDLNNHWSHYYLIDSRGATVKEEHIWNSLQAMKESLG